MKRVECIDLDRLVPGSVGVVDPSPLLGREDSRGQGVVGQILAWRPIKSARANRVAELGLDLQRFDASGEGRFEATETRLGRRWDVDVSRQARSMRPAFEEAAGHEGACGVARGLWREPRGKIVIRRNQAAGRFGKLSRMGATDLRVSALRVRLALTADLAAGTSGNVFDEAVDGGVRHFQERNGLEPDGVVGPRSLMALNLSAACRVQQIIASMERWRWLPVALGSRYVLVNIARSDWMSWRMVVRS